MNAPHCCEGGSAEELWVPRVGGNGGGGEEKVATAGGTELKDQEDRRIKKKGKGHRKWKDRGGGM